MGMKLICACLMALSFLTSPVFAQEQPPSTQEIVSKMQSKLGLSQDQITAITPIIERYTSKREELGQGMNGGAADKNSIHSQMKQLKEDEKQELSQILSADQVSQWGQMQNHAHKHSSEGGGPGGGENAGAQ